MNNRLAMVLFASTAFVMLTGWHGGCGATTPEARVKQASRFVHSHTDDFLDDVDATDDQRTKVHGLADRVLEQAMPLIPEHQKAKEELIAEWKSKNPDPAHVHAVIDGRIDALKKVLHTGADAAIELHNLLTPEQRTKIDERLPCD